MDPHLIKGLTFDSNDLTAIALAFDDVCKALNLDGNRKTRAAVAERFIELAGAGERSPAKLRDRVLAEANRGTGQASHRMARSVQDLKAKAAECERRSILGNETNRATYRDLARQWRDMADHQEALERRINSR